MATEHGWSAGTPPVLRCLAVWAAVGAVAALLGSLVAADLVEAWQAGGEGWRRASLEVLLGWTASAVAVAALAWLWVVAGIVALDAARGLRRTSVPGCPDLVRRLVLVACGVAVGSGLLVAPASADSLPAPAPVGSGAGGSLQQSGSVAGGWVATRERPAPNLDGLPMPDRAPTPPGGAPAVPDAGRVPSAPLTPLAPRPPGDAVVVVPGDSLWALAAADLETRSGAEPSDAAVDARWRELHLFNLDVVGDDPDVIRPGQSLRLPAPDPTQD